MLPRVNWLLIPALLLAFAGHVYGEEEQMEEVVVTGSYIKRDNFDMASPMQIIDQIDIAAEATPALGEILANETFNFGSDIFANGYAARYQNGNATWANLRGLGSGATLDLVDGKRTIESNLNNILPQIAIARIDILKDGASALYGSEAVAGVVNIIPRKNFTGMEMSAFYTQDGEGDHSENVFEFIMGSDTNNGHVMFAVEARRRNELTQKERPEFLRGGFNRSETGNPGAYIVPNRDATTGLLTGTTSNLADPGCGVVDGPGGTDVSRTRNNISGQLKYNGQVCYFYFGEYFNFVNANKQVSAWMTYQYEFNHDLDFEVNLRVSKQNSKGRSSTTNPGGAVGDLPLIAGEHPGNPWRAMAGGLPIFAQDADGNGIPDRDADGDGIADPGAEGNTAYAVVLAADPFDPASGIAFNEDVRVAALRLFGKLGNQPKNRRSDGANRAEHSWEGFNVSMSTVFNYQIPDSSWNVMFSANFQRNDVIIPDKNASLQAVIAGLNGELGLQGDEYYNPFSTVALTCVDRVCTDTGATYDNSDDVIEAIDYIVETVDYYDYQIYDLLATGELFQMPGGMAQTAIGAQYRDFQQENRADPHGTACNRWINGCEKDFIHDRQVKALFFELGLPLSDSGFLGNLELNLAGRYSDYGGGLDDFNPKVSFRWQPIQQVSLRGSYSTAFIAPSLGELYAESTSFLQTVQDRVSGDAGTFRTNTFRGNPNLKPETADVWNIGVSISLLEGDLNFGIDYAVFDFKDRIATTNAQNVIDEDYALFIAWTGANGTDPTDPAVQAAWIACCESSSLIRDPSGALAEILTSYVNANTMNVRSYDLYANYHLNTNIGDWHVSINATHMDQYEYDLGGALVGDGVGKQNDQIGAVPPTPEWQVVGQLDWSMNQHHALLRLRWKDEIEWDSAWFGTDVKKWFQTGTPPSWCSWCTTGADAAAFLQYNTDPGVYHDIEDLLYVDIAYSYNFTGVFGGDRMTRLEVGARNVLDEMPDPMFNLGGIATYVHDPRGRMLYLRLNQDL